MLSHFLLSPIFLSTLVLQAAATEYCQCENPQYGHTFGGINNKCKDLSWDWCSTNCDFFAGNCDYCQFKPAGHGPDADYQQLKNWCFSQTDWDASKQRYFKGSQVYCYSAKNARPKAFGNKGCDHEDNGDLPRDVRAFLRIKLQGGWYQRRGCDNLMKTDWADLVAGVLRRNSDCVAINNSTARYVIDCPYTSNEANNEKRRVDFKDYCERSKGKWYLRDDGPDLLEANEIQQPLAVAEKDTPGIQSSLEHESIQREDIDEAWAYRVDNTKQNGGRKGGRLEALLEEEDVTITFVAQDL